MSRDLELGTVAMWAAIAAAIWAMTYCTIRQTEIRYEHSAVDKAAE